MVAISLKDLLKSIQQTEQSVLNYDALTLHLSINELLKLIWRTLFLHFLRPNISPLCTFNLQSIFVITFIVPHKTVHFKFQHCDCHFPAILTNDVKGNSQSSLNVQVTRSPSHSADVNVHGSFLQFNQLKTIYFLSVTSILKWAYRYKFLLQITKF